METLPKQFPYFNDGRHSSTLETTAASASSEVEGTEMDEETHESTNTGRGKETKGKRYRKKKSTPRHRKLQSNDTLNNNKLDEETSTNHDDNDSLDKKPSSKSVSDVDEEVAMSSLSTETSRQTSQTESPSAQESKESKRPILVASTKIMSEGKSGKRGGRGRGSRSGYPNTGDRGAEDNKADMRCIPKKRKREAIEGIDRMHNAAMASIEDAHIKQTLPTGCVSERLPYYNPSVLQHQEVPIPTHYHQGKEVPHELALLLDNFKKDYMQMMDYIQTDTYKQNTLNQLEEEVAKKTEGLRKKEQINCQIQDLQSDCVALLIVQMEKLGIMASTPKEFTEQAKQIVCQHNNLQQNKTALEEDIRKLIEENEDLMRLKEKELTDEMVQKQIKANGKLGGNDMLEIHQMVQQGIQDCLDLDMGTHRKLRDGVTLTKVGATTPNKKREEPIENTVEVRKLHPDEPSTRMDVKLPNDTSVIITKKIEIDTPEMETTSEVDSVQALPGTYQNSNMEKSHAIKISDSYQDIEPNNNTNGISHSGETIKGQENILPIQFREPTPNLNIDFEDRVKSIITSALAEDIETEGKASSPVESIKNPSNFSMQCTPATVLGNRQFEINPRTPLYDTQLATKPKATALDQRVPRKNTRTIPIEPREYFHESLGPPIDPRLTRIDYKEQIVNPPMNDPTITSQEMKPQDLRIPIQATPYREPIQGQRSIVDSKGMLIDPRMMTQNQCGAKQNQYLLPKNPINTRNSPFVSVGDFISKEVEKTMPGEHTVIGEMSSDDLIACSVENAIQNTEHKNDSPASRLSKIIEDSVRGQPEPQEHRSATYSPVSRNTSHTDMMMEGLACPRGIKSPVTGPTRIPNPTVPSSLPQVEGLAARFSTYFDKETLDRQGGTNLEGFAGRFTSPDLQQASSRPTSVTSQASLHTPDPLPENQDHKKNQTSPLKSPVLPPKKSYIEDEMRKGGRDETRQWQDEISAGFDRLLGLATEVDKRRKSSEPNSPTHLEDQGPSLPLQPKTSVQMAYHPNTNDYERQHMGLNPSLPYEQPRQMINTTSNIPTTTATVPGENLPEHHFKKRYFNQEYQRQQAQHMKGIQHGFCEPQNPPINKQKYEAAQPQQAYRQYNQPRRNEVGRPVQFINEGEMLQLSHEPPHGHLNNHPHLSQDRKRSYDASRSSRIPIESMLRHPPPQHHDAYIEARMKEGTLSPETLGRYSSSGITFRPPSIPRHMSPYRQPSNYPRPPTYDPQLMTAMNAYRHQMMYRPQK